MPARTPLKPVDHFYRVAFANETALLAWVWSLLDVLRTPEGETIAAVDPRLVIFIPLRPQGQGAAHAYVSPGARSLAELGGWVELEPRPIPIQALPDGLSLVIGSDVDAEAYERRASRRLR